MKLVSETSPMITQPISGRSLATAAVLLLGLSNTACLERDLRPVNPCTRSRTANTVNVNRVDNVDLLFVIDNSGSMEAEQRKVREQIPRMVRVLTSGDRNPDDGVTSQDFPPVRSLHIGVVSTNMGVGRTLAGCNANGPNGDDGRLAGQASVAGGAGIAACAGNRRYFDFTPGGGVTPEAFALDVSCVVNGLGITGCGVERQMDAMLRALSPATAGENGSRSDLVLPVLNGVIGGQAGASGANAGFIRPDSVLAVVLVTDEADASYNEQLGAAALIDGAEPHFARRVPLTPGYERPAADIARVLRGLRSSANLLVFAGIVGLPLDPIDPANPNSERIYVDQPLETLNARPEMQFAPYDSAADCPSWVLPSQCAGLSTMRTELRPVCADAENPTAIQAVAAPGRQYVQLVQELNRLNVAGTTLQSICSRDYSSAIDKIIEKITEALRGTCLQRPLNKDAAGLVQCNVYEILPPDETCANIGVAPSDTNVIRDGDDQRERCRLPQIAGGLVQSNTVPPGESGWYYDDFSVELGTSCGGGAQRIAFVGREPNAGSDIEYDCFQTIIGGSGDVRIGTFCDPTGPGRANRCADVGLACDPCEDEQCEQQRTCQQPCTIDSDCSENGLVGYVCDTRTGLLGVNGPHNFCVNPTCS